MNRSLPLLALAIVSMLTIGATRGGASALTRAVAPVREGPAPHASVRGPQARVAPEGAEVVRSAAALARAIEDPHGPREIWIAPGVYRGDLVVRRTVALRGEADVVLEGTGAGTVVTVDAPDVVLENLRVRRSGRRHTAEDAGIKGRAPRLVVRDVSTHDTLFGIVLGPCPACLVERVHVEGLRGDEELRGDGIKLWESNDSIVRDSIVEQARDLVVWYSRRVRLEKNTVRGGRYGAHLMYAHDSVVLDNRLTGNVVGIFVMYGSGLRLERNVLAGARGAAGVGVGFKESDGVVVRENWIVGNTTGTYLDRTPRTASAPAVFDGNVFALNDVGARFHGADEGVRFVGNDFRENVTPVEVEGGGVAMGVTFRGNRWSDYVGYDLDGDGIGDVPHEVKRLSGELTDARPPLKLFQGTAAFALVDMIAHAAPVLAAHTLFVDPAPVLGARRSP